MDNENMTLPQAENEPAKSNIPARMRLSGQPLNPIQLQRLREQKHLAETKLNHIEDSMEALRKQMQWVRRWEEVRLMQAEEKQRLYNLNKQYATISESERELRRYETFEHMQGCFQRVHILEREKEENRRLMAELERDSEATQQQRAEQDKVQQRATDERESAEARMQQAMETIFHALQLERANELTQANINDLKEELAQTNEHLDNLQRESEEIQSNIELVGDELERHRTGRQNMEIHRRMMEHADAVLVRLDKLRDERKTLDNLKKQQATAATRQDSENNLLGRIFAQYQDVAAQIGTITGELNSHRSNTLGNDRNKLEGRSQQLKTRRQMLISAQSLWNRISTGYISIDEKTRQLNERRLKIEHTEAVIQQLDEEASRIARLCHEKEYTYMLSKSQNVIQLRFDLQEGSACSVCGATHHPYHSDTMLEQSKLIGEFKTEYELMAAENRNKQKALYDLRLELAELKGRYSAEEIELSNLKTRQQQDVREWTTYASLDRTFQDSSPSTNLEARQAMLRQLIDNIGREVEEAQKELDAFNYHQERIAELSEELQKLEQRKNELNIRLNEVNTGCQVMAGQVERLQSQIDSMTERYTLTYEQLDAHITLPDWLREWRQSHEGLRGRIQQLMEVWRTINRQIDEETAEVETLQTQQEGLQRLIEQTSNCRDTLLRKIEQLQENMNKQRNELSRLTGDETGLTLYQRIATEVKETRRKEEDEMAITRQLCNETEHIKGRNDFHLLHAKSLDEQIAQQRTVLDIFMRNYNMHNPPVQYAELERIFEDGRDWNELRAHVNQVIMERALAQERMNELGSRIISLQAEGGRAIMQDEGLQASLVDQYEALQGRQREILLQIARINILLEEKDNQ